jgi:hypothetical protein
MRRLIALAVGLLLAPSAAFACPGCVASPYGDRSFGWAYLVLYVAPFFIASAVAGALVYYGRSGRRATAPARRTFWLLRRRPRPAAEASGRGTSALREGHELDKETT